MKITTEALFSLLDGEGDSAWLASRALWEGTREGWLLTTPRGQPVEPLVQLARRLQEAEEGRSAPAAFFLRLARRHTVASELTRHASALKPWTLHEELAELPPLIELPGGLPPEVEFERDGYWKLRVRRSIEDRDLSESLGPPADARTERCGACAALDWEAIADFSVTGNAGGWHDQIYRCTACGLYTEAYRESG